MQEDDKPRARQICRFLPRVPDPADPSERMRQAIHSPQGQKLYSKRIRTVEPVFARVRQKKLPTCLNHRDQAHGRTQLSLNCMVHNIEKR